ncbi:hypothetical protein PIB30_077449 [Stylosanthes scabra]|uniref:Uncharacterized protein n=1 Tax=Stylosanthes scabra TaxID=79078 RepID=A0ABU6ZPT3_9FABA|nr:hypothetical protein [Stylosanthes scabra]
MQMRGRVIYYEYEEHKEYRVLDMEASVEFEPDHPHDFPITMFLVGNVFRPPQSMPSPAPNLTIAKPYSLAPLRAFVEASTSLCYANIIIQSFYSTMLMPHRPHIGETSYENEFFHAIRGLDV